MDALGAQGPPARAGVLVPGPSGARCTHRLLTEHDDSSRELHRSRGPASTGVQAPRGQLLPSEAVWVLPPLGGPGFVRGNHTALRGNATALRRFRIEKGHCSPSVPDGRVTECVGLAPPAQPRRASSSPAAGRATSTPESFPQMGRSGDRAGLARVARRLPPLPWRQDI